MATVLNFEDLKVWQKSRLLCQHIFELIATGKFAKDFSLIDQINRSSGSIMDNITEGFGRLGNNEFIIFLLIQMLRHWNANPNFTGLLTEATFQKKY